MNVLKELRTNRGLTQQELADKCGVVRQTISNIELGMTKPSVKLAKKLDDIFGVDWTIFFDEEVILTDKEG